MCFACGPKNPIGLKLDFKFENDKYVARFIPRTEHQGYDNITHGGIISTLLDEAMAKLVYAMGFLAVTAQLQIKFRKPAHTCEELVISGWLVSEKRHRAIDCAAEIRNIHGELIAEATGRMIAV
ncbi:MAG: PaaI family thioesterase [Armatimonadota bacterium]